MESAINDVARIFELKFTELELLENRLNKKLRCKFGSSTTPAGLFCRLKAITRELSQLYDETQEVDAEKEEVIAALTRLTATNTNKILKLQTQCNLTPDSESHQEIQELLDTAPIERSTKKVDPITEEQAFVPGVSAEAFTQVSKTIRGRTPLAEINMLYGVVCNYFEQESKSPPLTLHKLALLGAKVGGLMAHNAINTLRHLNLIKVTKQDGQEMISLPKPIRSKTSKK